MPSLQGRFFNLSVRLLTRRRYGSDEFALARKVRKNFGAPKFFQWMHTRNLNLRPVTEENVRGEWLETKNAVPDSFVFYVHGGGFVSCSAGTHRPITATLARLTDFRVFSLDYRLAPEHRFPAALEDVLAAYKWLLAQNVSPKKLAVAGDSAGGGLVLSLLLRLHEENLPLPACAVCFSPWTDLSGTGGSRDANAQLDAMFCPENNDEFARAYLGDETPADDPFVSPVFGDYKDLPPVLFQVGSTEMLLDDSKRIHEKILKAGGDSELEIYPDIFHCWQMLSGVVPEAREALGKASEFIRRQTSKTQNT